MNFKNSSFSLPSGNCQSLEFVNALIVESPAYKFLSPFFVSFIAPVCLDVLSFLEISLILVALFSLFSLVICSV
jgi:hypothetical protein